MRMVIAVMVLATACGGTDVSRSIGAACTANGDCDESCLMGGEFPGGFCSISCDDDNGCPADTDCVEKQGGVCLFTCAVNGDCTFLGQGYLCKPTMAHGTQDMVKVCIGG